MNKNINDTKEAILRVANNLFIRFGFHKTSIDEIAKIARKAKGSIYYHFASKEDLFREVVANEINNLKKQLENIINSKDSAIEKIKKYFIKRMEILNSSANYHETLKADFFEHFHFIDDLRDEMDLWEKEKIEKIISEGIDKGEFKQIFDTDILVDVFIMVLKSFETNFFVQKKYDRYSPHFEDLIKILTNGLKYN